MGARARNIRAEFDHELEKCKRQNWKGQYFYHPLDNIKSWMVAQGEDGIRNAEHLLDSVADPNRFAPTDVDAICNANALLVFAVLLHLERGELIPVFQMSFSDDHLDIELPSVLYKELKRRGVDDPSDVLDRFDKARWAFCPARFEDMHHGTKRLDGGNWILPFCGRERVGEGGTAVVDVVLLQADLMPESLIETAKGYEYDDQEFGLCYEFAIKSYGPSYRELYESEMDNFRGMKSVPGVVKCLGCYRHEESTGDTTFNILLEFGELDLEEYLAVQYPPVLNNEITKFWENIFGVATTLAHIHNLKYDRIGTGTKVFDGLHGDIKPNNILSVKGKFKLVDFGFAKFQPNRAGRTATTEMVGLTYTYGAPECDAGRRNPGDPTQHTQKIDMWSLGCVFSSIATWVVLGSFACNQYDRFRKLAIADLIEERSSNPGFVPPIAQDGFHDGSEVLQAVRDWHDYLRSSMRKSDTITNYVLDYVDKYLLQSDPDRRKPSVTVDRDLKDILAGARGRYQTSLSLQEIPRIPAQTLKALLTLDDTAPPDVRLEAKLSQASADRRITALQRQSHLKTTRLKKSERISEMVVPARVAGRQEALETELTERGETYTRLGVVFERPIVESPTLMASKSEVDPEPLKLPPSGVKVGKATDQSLPGHRVELPGDANANKHQWDNTHGHPSNVSGNWDKYVVDNDVGVPQALRADPSNMTNGLPGIRLQPETDFTHHGTGGSEVAQGGRYGQHAQQYSPRQQDGFVQRDHPTQNFYAQLPAQSAEYIAAERPHRSLPSVVPRYIPRDPEIVKLRHELDLLWKSERTIPKVLRNKIPADKKLKDFIMDRDIKFLVDNGWHMRPHWKWATFVVQTLAMKVGPLDENGLDLLFTIGSDNKEENVKGFDIPHTFAEAMERAMAPDDPGLYQTPMLSSLQSILSNYRQDMTKKLTIFVLTTGVWEGAKPDVERMMAATIRAMCKAKTDFEAQRRCTIQFVSFGDNPEGLKRLKDLDDELSDYYKIPDVIDTEPWDGNPEQMLLGSIKASMDGLNSPKEQIPSPNGDYLSYPTPRTGSPPPSPGPSRSTSTLTRTYRRLSHRFTNT